MAISQLHSETGMSLIKFAKSLNEHFGLNV